MRPKRTCRRGSTENPAGGVYRKFRGGSLPPPLPLCTFALNFGSSGGFRLYSASKDKFLASPLVMVQNNVTRVSSRAARLCRRLRSSTTSALVAPRTVRATMATEPSRRLLHLFGTVCRSQYGHRRHCKFFAADGRPSFLPSRTTALTKSVSLH